MFMCLDLRSNVCSSALEPVASYTWFYSSYQSPSNSLSSSFHATFWFAKQQKWKHMQTCAQTNTNNEKMPRGVCLKPHFIGTVKQTEASRVAISASVAAVGRFIFRRVLYFFISNLAKQPVIPWNKPAQRHLNDFHFLSWNISDTWHKHFIHASKPPSTLPSTLHPFVREAQSDCAAIVALPSPPPPPFCPQGPVQFRAVLAEKCPRRPKWNHSFSFSLWSG